MCCREAIRILMMSPIYWRMNVAERGEAVKEFCNDHTIANNQNKSFNKRGESLK